MEVMEKEKDAAIGVAEGSTELTLNDCYLLNSALEELIQACNTIPLGIAQRLFESKGHLENIVMEFDKKQKSILKKYVKIGKDNQMMVKIVNNKQEWDYKRKKDKDLAEKEMKSMFEGKTVFVKLEKFALSEIVKLEINPFRPQMNFDPTKQHMPEPYKVHFIMDLVTKYLITE